MNPANFSNVGGAMPGGANPQMPNNENAVIFNHAVKALQAQAPFSGWKAEVRVQERAIKVFQILSSLRLLQPQINIGQAAHAALTFEQKALREANQRAEYDKACNEKLAHIRDTRARQAAVMQNGIMPPGVGQNQVPGSMPPQMNRPMQASPIPNPEQVSMGMNDPNHRAALQQQQQQQRQQQSQAMLQQQQQQQQQQSQPQPQPQQPQSQRAQRPGANVSLPDDLGSLSPQEHEQVRRHAQQIMSMTSPEEIEKIKLNLQNMTPEQKQFIAKKQMDPLSYFFRCQAVNNLRRHKQRNMAHGPNAANNPMVGDPMTAQQRQMYQSMMNLQRNSTFPGHAQPGLDPSSFIGNVENIQGQQADGLRSQEAGQLVVPASSSQMNQPPFPTPHNVYQPGQPLDQGGQAGMNGAGISPQFLPQSQLQNPQPVQQDRSQHTTPSRAQAQAQAQAARMQAAQKAQMAMAQAGQGNPQLQQQIAQQSPAMPMLNRPMPPGQMSPTQVAAQARPPSRPQSMGQHPAGVQSLPGQPGIQGRAQIPANLPPQVQAQLARMTPDQLNAFLNAQRRRAHQNNQALAQANAALQQPVSMQQSLSQPGQGQPMVNNQMDNNQGLRASLGLQQQLPNMGGGQMQNQMSQQMSAQQQQQQQRQQLYQIHLLRQQSGGLEMTPDQIKEMDGLPFPPALIGNSQTSPVPKHVKTWGQLKQWAAENPQVMGGVDPNKLITFQKYHLAQIVAQGKRNGRNPDQAGQGHGAAMPASGRNQYDQHFPGGPQGQLPMSVPPVTPQEVQMARHRLGVQVQNYTDEQLRDVLFRSRLNKLQTARARAMHSFAGQNVNQGQMAQPAQPIQQPPAIAPQGTPQAKPQPQPAQQTPQANQQAQVAKAQNATPGKGPTKGPAAKQPPKRKSNAEESLEGQNPPGLMPTQSAAPQVPQVPSMPGAPPRPNLNFTREQLAAMAPHQREQAEAYIRRQQNQNRTPINRAAAEEAWNNLPEHIKRLYNDISRTVPFGDPIPLPPEQKAIMSQQLRDCIDMLSRMDTLVQWFAKVPNQDKNVRSLLGMRIQLLRQFKQVPEWTLNDELTLSPERLTGCIGYIRKLFTAMIQRVNLQQQHQPAGMRPNMPQGPAPTVPPANQNNMPALNASNLQQLQQQEEALQRARRASSQTTSGIAPGVPPAPFGAPSPQGVPHAYGPGSMPPEKLKLPPAKRRKHSHAGVTSGQVPTPGTASAKTPTNKPTASAAFKCNVPECQHHYHGFVSQSALDKHIEENHKAEENIEDPLQFAIESMQSSLVKEEKPEPKKGVAMEAPTVPGKHEVKPEGVTPVTTGTTPMGRVPSHIGLKSASPASNQQMTPRPSSGKVPTAAAAAAAMKSTVSKEAKKEAAKVEPSDMDTTTKDPWADSTISLEAIHDAFMDFGNEGLPGLGVDPMDEFLNSEMFTTAQSKDTPESVETGAGTQTPKDGELSKDEEMNVKIGSDPDENWIPADWVYLPSRFDDGFMLNEPSDFDWESIDRKEADLNDDTGIAIYAM